MKEKDVKLTNKELLELFADSIKDRMMRATWTALIGVTIICYMFVFHEPESMVGFMALFFDTLLLILFIVIAFIPKEFYLPKELRKRIE